MPKIWLSRLSRFAWATAISFTWLCIIVGGVMLLCAWHFGWEAVFGTEMEATLRPYLLSLPLVAMISAAGDLLLRRGRSD